MYGWRSKLGFIVPANNTVIEPELYSIVPSGVSLHFTKLDLRTRDHELVDKAAAVKLLECSGVDVIAYACMSGSLMESSDWEVAIFEQTKIKAITAATALKEAIYALKVKNVALVTHYPERWLVPVREWFQRCGLSIAAVETVDLQDPRAVSNISTEVVCRLAKTANKEEVDALCLLATDLQTFPIIQQLENDLGKPVISSNQSILWKALRLAGVNDVIASHGSLFSY
jgi:maleate isomerase